MNRSEKSLRLFEAVGQIDEKILHECSSLYPALRRRKKTVRRVVLLAAAISLVFTVLLTVGAAQIVRGLSGVYSGNFSGAPAEEKLCTVEKSEVRPLLFAGSPVIIYALGDGNYAAKTLSSADLSLAVSAAEAPAGKVEAGEAVGEKVWISDGQGVVFSPYLEFTAGNIGYGELFDYEPEVVPDASLAALLERSRPSV